MLLHDKKEVNLDYYDENDDQTNFNDLPEINLIYYNDESIKIIRLYSLEIIIHIS